MTNTFVSLALILSGSATAMILLRAFIDVKDHTDTQMAWMVGIHMTFVVSGVLLALMDRITEGTAKH